MIKTLLPMRSITNPKIGDPTAEIYDGIPKSYAAYTSDNLYFFVIILVTMIMYGK